MKKFILIFSIVSILFSGCSRTATKDHETNAPAKAEGNLFPGFLCEDKSKPGEHF